MAYYDDGYMWPQEHTNHDPFPYQDSVSFSTFEPYDHDTKNDAYGVYEYHEPKFLNQYYHYGYDYGYGQNPDPSANLEISYFAHSYMEPELIKYEPVGCDTSYLSYHTQYSISYSKVDSGFNEPEFEEYDPTPYGGGYDIVSTYGKPLPPSDKTCYPHSNSKPINPVSEPKPEPESQPKPKPELKTIIKPEPELSKPDPDPSPVPVHDPVGAVVPVPEPLGLIDEGKQKREEESYPVYGYDYPWPEYDRGNGIGVGYYDYGYGKHVVPIPPCEYNPEVVDLCENIFGNWPCLARIRKQQMGNRNDCGISNSENRHRNPWEECANYLFGHPTASYNQ